MHTKLTSPEFVTLEEVPEPKIQKGTDVIIRIRGAGGLSYRSSRNRGDLAREDEREATLCYGT